MSRETLIQNLKSIYGIMTDNELVNNLQDHGICSDNCVELADVADRDLVRGLNRAMKEGAL